MESRLQQRQQKGTQKKNSIYRIYLYLYLNLWKDGSRIL